MGNESTKQGTSGPSPRSVPLQNMNSVEAISEEVVCSICLEMYDDPVTIDCGHNFCQVCISAHWAANSKTGSTCPECRRTCSRNHMIPALRMKNVVTKIRDALQKRREYSEAAGPPAPCQIIGLDKDSKLIVHEEELRSCLEQKSVWNRAVCFISVIGEQRKGKSFLLNYILRCLNNLGVTDDSWMGRDDEPLEGFDWRPGVNSTTKGVWMWNKPFLAERDGQKIAIFLVDTEGSLDIEQDKEASVKLSAFSMLMSSYLIYNVATMLKETDLEYLEMFVHVAEGVGKAFSLQPIQHLEFLVRDHFYPPEFGSAAGQEYLKGVIKKLEASSRHKRSLELLQSRASCYLLPFPGKKIAVGGHGSLSEMDEDFRDFLKKYVHDVVTSTVGKCIKTDSNGAILTCRRMVGKIKKFVEIMKTTEYGFSSPLEMAIALKNKMALENFRKEFHKAVQQEEKNSDNFVKTLKTTPKEMKAKLERCVEELLASCKNELEGEEEKKQEHLMLLAGQIQEDLENYTSGYAKKFKTSAIKAGVAAGAAGIGLAGGMVGAGVAGAVLATEALVILGSNLATVAVGALAGTGTFALVGGGVGAKLGSTFGKKEEENLQMATEGTETEEEDFVDLAQDVEQVTLLR
ncbi:RING finger protein 112-like [Protopterus annectens]|uniref:RING finger protein 112-like n=1 Tax=Protopterus annectens TaxID=7888 RepID=UPI001CFAAA45|nr:RING finger protein 112-like [Protopterus annectens]XP_043942592.1 RING finger protein 112-like [Protopterus annectens]XP_043942593.1 RING finger protein 112-like [Protopterus annectens]XP_043942594.1 RING finger protein 112-like [Protopterus annectens]XP_043942595.1 RING finger protein 112-like [Protopterus annectens]XP_043942596.1 RING finger protein 112-like [Protopterus annectens]XP_043942597.1 RING finger protein 112-like [Protopterus annectens]